MGVFEHFPYTNFHDINLDRILERTKEAEEAAQQAADDAGAIHDEATQALQTAQLAQGIATNARNTANSAASDASAAVTTANNALAAAQANATYEYSLTLDHDNSTFEIDILHSATLLNTLIQGIAAGRIIFSFEMPSGGVAVYSKTSFKPDNITFDPDDPSIIHFGGTAFVVAHEGSPDSDNFIYPIMFEGVVDRSNLIANGTWLTLNAITPRI